MSWSTPDFSAFVDQQAPAWLRRCLAQRVPADEAEDLVAEVITHLWRQVARAVSVNGDHRTRLTAAYANRVLNGALVNRIRRLQRERLNVSIDTTTAASCLPAKPAGETDAGADEQTDEEYNRTLTEIVATFLVQLTPREREVVEQIARGRTHEQIAQKLAVSKARVEQLVDTSRRRIVRNILTDIKAQHVLSPSEQQLLANYATHKPLSRIAAERQENLKATQQALRATLRRLVESLQTELRS